MKKVMLWRPLSLGVVLMLSACQIPAKNDPEAAAADSAGADPSVDVGFLLSMTYEEARQLGQQHLDMSPYCRVVADHIVVLRQSSEGVPLRARATGRVFLEQQVGEGMVALGQEAYIDRGLEIIMRGRPLLRRGHSVVEGLKDDTVFYMRDTRLQVIGNHRVPKRHEESPQVMMAAASGAASPRNTGNWDVTPTWQRTWKEGPNPLLPALSPEDIPANIRATPLLPPLSENDQPRLPGEDLSESNFSADGRKLGRRSDEEGSLGRRRLR